MSDEPASGPPIAKSKTPENLAPPNKVTPEVEYDDFGLPIRKPRPRTPVADSSDSEDDAFKSAVASKSASQEKITQLEREATKAEKVPEAEVEAAVGQEIHKPLVNGHTEEKEVKDNQEVKVEKEEQRESQKQKEEQKENHVEMIKEKDNEKEQEDMKKKVEKAEEAAENEKVEEKSSQGKEGIPDTRARADTTESHHSKAPAHTQHAKNVSISEYSHMALAPQTQKVTDQKEEEEEDEWQTMPAYARYDMYDDDNKLIAKENEEELEDMTGYGNLGGAAKGYTRVTMDDDVQSQTSMDENTAYLFKEKTTTLQEDDEDEAARDPLAQMQTTKSLLTEGQRIAYVGLVRLAIVEMENRPGQLERTRGAKKVLELTQETTKMWGQKMMVRLYGHMDIDSSEQIMIEQLQEHGVIPADLTPALMANARVKNPAAEEVDSSKTSISSPRPDSEFEKGKSSSSLDLKDEYIQSPPPPPYEDHEGDDLPAVRTPSQLPQTKNIDIDLRWTILCDLFLVLIADSVYDARSRQLLETVGKSLGVDWLEICRFEKRVTDALEMQEEASKENWNEDEHMEDRRKRALKRRLAFMGLATVGGSLVIGLSAGLLAPVIGAGLAAGFTTIGVAGTSGFLAGAGGAAIITTTGVLSGGTIAVRAANRRTGSVKTFEYRPLHNNKRVNLIVTIAGWMNGKIDDIRLPYSTVDPIMGDMYSVLWEPEMLRSMGDTINILATEVLKS
jgi:hypothetical protein